MKLIILFALIITFLGLLRASKKSRNVNNSTKNFKLDKNNFYTWMNFSKKKRYELAKKDSTFYMNQRKNLLKEIRNEYKNISISEK
tara:strand:- start:231 stop:488 length:258 start_codon:yes stop_codon:yes gene_type:complete